MKIKSVKDTKIQMNKHTSPVSTFPATVKNAVVGVDDGAYAHDCKHQWILCLLPNEALSEALEAALFEWKQTDPARTPGYSIAVRKETSKGYAAVE